MIRIETGRLNLEHLDFSPDGRFLLTTPDRETEGITILNLSQSTETSITVFHPEIGYGEVRGLIRPCFNSQNHLVALIEVGSVTGSSRSFSVFSWPNGKTEAKCSIYPHEQVRGFELSNARNSLIILRNYSIETWTMDHSRPKIVTPFDSSKIPISVSQNLEWYTLIDNNRDVTVQNLRSMFSSFYFSQPSIDYLFFSRSDRYLLCIFEENSLLVFGLQERNKLRSQTFDYQVSQIVLTPDDRHFLLTEDNLVHVFDLLTGAEKTCFDFGLQEILAINVTDDGTMFAVTDARGTIVIADIDF